MGRGDNKTPPVEKQIKEIKPKGRMCVCNHGKDPMGRPCTAGCNNGWIEE